MKVLMCTVYTCDFKDPSKVQNPEPTTQESFSKSVPADYDDDMDSGKFEIYLEECCKALKEGMFLKSVTQNCDSKHDYIFLIFIFYK